MKRNRRRLLAIGLALVLCFLMGAGSTLADQNTIRITSVEELQKLSDNCSYDAYSRDKTVLLENDLDLSGSGFTPIPTFGGVFDGQGHTISGLSMEGDASHMGLFRYVQEGGTVKDLTVTGNLNPSGGMSEIGAIVGTNLGTISGCSFSGTVNGSYNVGGIAGTNEPTGMIYNCKTEGYASGDHYVGGIVGQNLGTISYCSNTAGVNLSTDESVSNVTEVSIESLTDEEGEVHTATDVGGIAGFSSGVVIGCTNWGSIGYVHVGFNVGGVVGRQSGLVSGCTNWGEVSGRKDVGGIAGQMEPYITIDLGAGSAAKLESDLNALHDGVDVLLNHTGAAASAISATIGAIAASASSATEHARYVAEQTASYVDDATGTINEVMLRISTAEKMVSPAITEFSQGAISLDGATRYFSDGFDSLDAIDEMTASDRSNFKSATTDLTTTSERLNAAMAYCGWLMKVADNQAGTGNYDLLSERPDNWLEMSNKYGYQYDPDALTSYEGVRDALLKGVGDAASAAGILSGDISTMTRIINLYYLTEDVDGNTRMENTSAAFKTAFDTLRGATSHFSTGMSYMDQVGSYLSGNEDLTLPGVDSDFRTAMEGMFDDLGGVSNGLASLSTQSANFSSQIISDMQTVNDQFNVVMIDLVDILQLAMDPDLDNIIEDTSEADLETTNGKVYNCENYGAAKGDINAGGIAGSMAIEYDFDPRNDSNAIEDSTLTSKYFTKCVLAESRNYGTATSRHDCAGGVCGDSELGVITGCQGFGAVESTGGDYVGGIVGLSKSAVRSSWAKCAVTGGSYVGGVAGFGTNVSDCGTLVNLSARENCLGTIAGDLDADGSAVGNVYVHDSLSAIDGISYQGMAEERTYRDFMAQENVPAEFSSFTATFTANGEIVKTITFGYGGSIDESEIPECPVVEGNYGRWPEMNYKNLTFDLDVKAIYSSSAAVVEGDLYADDTDTPLVLVQGVFDPSASVHVAESTTPAPELPGNQTLEMQYDVEVLNDQPVSGDDAAVNVRVYAPEGTHTVYAYRDGEWTKVDASRDGSYLVFESPDRDVTFAVAKGGSGQLGHILIGLGVIAVASCLFYFMKKRKDGPDVTMSAPRAGAAVEAVPTTEEAVRAAAPVVETVEQTEPVTVPAVETVETEAEVVVQEAETVAEHVFDSAEDAAETVVDTVEDAAEDILEKEPEIPTRKAVFDESAPLTEETIEAMFGDPDDTPKE